MNKDQINKWQTEALSHIFRALARNENIRSILIFKGAIILNIHLSTERISLDIDSALSSSFAIQIPDRRDQSDFLAAHLPRAITRYFEDQEPVRYKLDNVKIELSPKSDHPRGWNAFLIKVSLHDFKYESVRGLPPLTIDIAAPETLTEHSVSDIPLDGCNIKVYTLERIAGEKCRAFLSTLPMYRKKVKKQGEAVRVKDLYDIGRILRAKPIANEGFWLIAGNEFKIACESRFIDCNGIDSFMEDWIVTGRLYQDDPIFLKDVTIEDVEAGLNLIVNFWTAKNIIPFSFDLPDKI